MPGVSTPTVLVTGAASGIGAACAARFADEGWQVIGWDLQTGNDRRVVWSQVDVTDWEGVHTAAGGLPALDCVVHCAGIAIRDFAVDMSREAWDRVVDVNLNGSFYVAHATQPVLAAGGGTLVMLASVAGRIGLKHRAAYGATKAAVLQLVRTLAAEWAPDGIRVVAVSPTFVRTPLVLEGIESGIIDVGTIERATPQARLLDPGEVAAVIFRLAGPDFAAVTGSEVLVDGGFGGYGGF
jgi:NAD(P)-dependent dehydrogenase (short-subunit alcohol dehydrogenase family)